jgi:tRNA (guanosine-2'-O-)-methyltransferase
MTELLPQNDLPLIDARFEALLPFLSDERLERFERVLSERTRHLTVVLENVFQSRNASAVMRSCDGFGLQDVHLIEDINPWVPNRGVSKGTNAWLTLHRYRSAADPTAACLERLRRNGYRIAVTSPHVDGYNVTDLPIDRPVAVVMGTEWQGVSDRMLEAADLHVAIPMHGFAESLNISVAAAVVIHELNRRLRNTPHVAWNLNDLEKAELRAQWAMASVKNARGILARLGVDPG